MPKNRNHGAHEDDEGHKCEATEISKKKRYNLKYRRRAIHEVHFVVGSRRKKGRAERASRPSIRAREGARGIELQRIENEKEEGASVASDRERAGRACERGYEREESKCKRLAIENLR